MKDQPKPPGRLGGMFTWMPKPAKIILLAVAILLVFIIVYLVLFGGKTTNSDQLISIMARAQEISRVSLLVQQQAKTADTKDLASTTETVLNSQSKELGSFLSKARVKVDPKRLVARLDKTTDTALEKALQNNSHDQTYYSYLKTNLGTYQSELQGAYASAGQQLQPILSSDFESIQTILTAPQLK